MRRVVCPVLWSAINRGQKPIPEDVKHLSEWCCSVFLGTCPSWLKDFMFNLEDQRNVGPLYLPAPSDVDCMYNHSSVWSGLFCLVSWVCFGLWHLLGLVAGFFFNTAIPYSSMSPFHGINRLLHEDVYLCLAPQMDDALFVNTFLSPGCPPHLH